MGGDCGKDTLKENISGQDLWAASANVFIATLPHFENFINFSYSFAAIVHLWCWSAGRKEGSLDTWILGSWDPWASEVVLQVNVLHSFGILYAVGVSISNTMAMAMASFIPLARSPASRLLGGQPPFLRRLEINLHK